MNSRLPSKRWRSALPTLVVIWALGTMASTFIPIGTAHRSRESVLYFGFPWVVWGWREAGAEPASTVVEWGNVIRHVLFWIAPLLVLVAGYRRQRKLVASNSLSDGSCQINRGDGEDAPR